MDKNVASPEFYYPYIIIFTIGFCIIQLIIFFLDKREKQNKNEDVEILSYDLLYFKKGVDLKFIYLPAFLFAKAGMWGKAPYTFMLFSTYHKFSIPEIANLYLIDAVFSLLTGPFLGIIADTFGRKLISILYPFNTIVILLMRMSGNKFMAYLAQCISGCSSGILATSFESWLNYEIQKLYENDKTYIQHYRKSLFSAIYLYDSILSIFVTIFGAILYNTFGIFASLWFAILLCFISTLTIAFQWSENKPNEKSSSHFFISMWEGVKLLGNFHIFCLGIVDSMHMSGINIFNFIWTPILQITANNKNINPGMIYIIMLISFLIHNKVLEMINKLTNVNYYYLCSIFTFIFMSSFAFIYIFEDWNTRIICLILISGSGGFFHPILCYIRSNLLIEQYRTLLMNVFRVPLNITVITMLLLTNYYDPVFICLLVAIVNIASFLFSIYLVYYHAKHKKQD